jgi:hypothetical protein
MKEAIWKLRLKMQQNPEKIARQWKITGLPTATEGRDEAWPSWMSAAVGLGRCNVP